MASEEDRQSFNWVGLDQNASNGRADFREAGREQQVRTLGIVVSHHRIHEGLKYVARVRLRARQIILLVVVIASDGDQAAPAHSPAVLKRFSRAFSLASAAAFFFSINASARA